MHLDHCLCAHIVPQDLTTRLALVMHHREVQKSSATGPLALAALTNSHLYVHGLRDERLDLNPLHEEGRRVLMLFPREGAPELSRELLKEDPRPVTLVVPDGNWRQARQAGKRIPGLDRAEAVTLPEGPPTRWGLRRETHELGLATFEAIARAMGILESPSVQAELESLFDRMVATTRVTRGEAASIETVADAAPELTPPLSILYADEHLVAIHKPAGLLVHRGWGNDEQPAVQRLRDQIGRFVYPVHRLDRATSGVLLFALSSEVARDMQVLFRERTIDKTYVALCRGTQELGAVDHPLAKEKGGEKRPARSDFRLLGAAGRYGLYEAKPATGRVHQLRRHLKHVSHPIIGDVRYGKGEHNRHFRERGFNRLALHCGRLAFVHPRTGVPVTITAALEGDFAKLLETLGLTSPF
ncbi:MAG: RluA family pseudouridine synthase [Polyangiales bacterium]|jgi:RluA family pseudouridine synthase